MDQATCSGQTLLVVWELAGALGSCAGRDKTYKDYKASTQMDFPDRRPAPTIPLLGDLTAVSRCAECQ